MILWGHRLMTSPFSSLSKLTQPHEGPALVSDIPNHIDPPDHARALKALPVRRTFKRVQKKGRGRMSARIGDLPLAPDVGLDVLPPLLDVGDVAGVDEHGEFVEEEQHV